MFAFNHAVIFSVFISAVFAVPSYYPQLYAAQQPSLWSVAESEPSARVSSNVVVEPYLNSISPSQIWSDLNIPGAAAPVAITAAPLVPAVSRVAAVPRVSPVPLPVSQSNQRGETIIHRPSPIVVRRPPTKIQINHPPLVVKPAPVVFHKPPARIVRPTVVKNIPPQVQVEPVFMKLYRPAEKKVIVNEPPCNSPVSVIPSYRRI